MSDKPVEPKLTPVTRIELKRIDLPGLVASDPMLRASPLCLSLGRDSLSKLLTSGSTWRFAPGAPVFSQGEPGDSLFLVLRGDIRLSAHVDGGKSRIQLGVASKGDIAGESEVIGHAQSRSYTAIAQGDLDVAEFPRKILLDISKSNVGLMLHLAEVRERRKTAGDELSDFMNRW
jgi:CRP-like cAMP-binding protein